MKHPHLIVLALLLLFGGFLMCAGFIFVGGSVWYNHHRDDYLEAPIAKTAYSAPPAPATAMAPASVSFVVVAAVDMPAGTKITDPASMLVLKPFVNGAEPGNGFKNPEDLRGKVLARDVDRNAPLTMKDVSFADDLFKPAPAGTRALTIRVGSDGASGFLLPGSRVDIIGKVPVAENAEKLVTKVIVEKVLILAVTTLREAPREEAGVIDSPSTITLAVTVEEAEKIVAAKERGPLTVVLRRPGE